jgi:hypothetical protein
MPGQRPAPGNFTVIAEIVAVDFHFQRFIATTETPAVVRGLTEVFEQVRRPAIPS